jgi:hypothetical protein
MHPMIKAFIVSDALLYSSLNIVNILFAVYVTTTVHGGTVESATGAIASGFVVRIIVELSIGRRSSKLSDSGKLWLVVLGMACISASYAGFAISHSLAELTRLWMLNGAGWGMALPTKLGIVAKYINHDQASQEWGLTDALNMASIVVTMAIGAYIVAHFSFGLMFALAAVINTLGIVPYVVFVATQKTQPN